MNVSEFANAVQRMRDLQKQWIAAHKIFYADDTLSHDRVEAEKKVDKALNERRKRLEEEVKKKQGDLFG